MNVISLRSLSILLEELDEITWPIRTRCIPANKCDIKENPFIKTLHAFKSAAEWCGKRQRQNKKKQLEILFSSCMHIT